jgi:hypothetical protein
VEVLTQARERQASIISTSSKTSESTLDDTSQSGATELMVMPMRKDGAMVSKYKLIYNKFKTKPLFSSTSMKSEKWLESQALEFPVLNARHMLSAAKTLLLVNTFTFSTLVIWM